MARFDYGCNRSASVLLVCKLLGVLHDDSTWADCVRDVFLIVLMRLRDDARLVAGSASGAKAKSGVIG